MACILGFSSGAKAQSYQADENEPLITIVSPDGETQLTSNCTWKPAKGNDNYLPENNEAYYDAGNYTSVRSSTAIFPLIGIPIPQE